MYVQCSFEIRICNLSLNTLWTLKTLQLSLFKSSWNKIAMQISQLVKSQDPAADDYLKRVKRKMWFVSKRDKAHNIRPTTDLRNSNNKYFLEKKMYKWKCLETLMFKMHLIFCILCSEIAITSNSCLGWRWNSSWSRIRLSVHCLFAFGQLDFKWSTPKRNERKGAEQRWENIEII